MKNVKNLKSIIIIFSVMVFMLVAYFISGAFFEPKAYNFMVQNFTANKSGSKDIVVIIIDDKSIAQIRWPWKRELYGKIFEYLNNYTDAKVIGFDSIITALDKYNPDSDKRFFSVIRKIDKLVVGFSPLNTPYSSKADGEIYDKKFKDKFAINIEDKRTQKYSTYFPSLSPFPPAYFNSIHKVGSILITPEPDGYIRTMDQLIDYKGTLYPSLTLRMYAYLINDDHFTVKNNSLTSAKSKLNIPISSNDNGVYNNIHYYKSLPNSEYSHKTYSAVDIINSLDNIKKGKPPIISPEEFKDKIVFLGANAKAVALGLEDAKPTPMLLKHPGVDIQATNLDNLLHNEFLVQTTPFQDFLILIILLSATFLVIRYYSLFMSLGIICLMIISYIIFCAICYRFNLVVSVITPIALQLITMAMSYSYRFILEGRNKEKIKHAMGKYISQDVMQSVVKNIDGLKLGGKRANLTVLFADIRGFTSMSEKLTAEEVSVILNEYFTEIEPIISKYNGVINKFIGDAVMAIFGEPIQDKNHAVNAVKCANEMLKKVEQLQQKWLREGKPKIEIGVGINTGEAFVGNIGSEKRLEYTVIGDMVNLASRIESYNKVYKTNFLISSTTYEQVRNIADVIKISEVTIRGKAKKLNIYEVLRLVK